MSDLETALSDADASVRLRAVMAAGIDPVQEDIDVLVERCAMEPDFQVREMLTWALLRQPADLVVPRVIAQLTRPEPQARSQALHTLSKLKDPSAWPAVAARLDDTDRDVVRTAWYSAAALVPENERAWLAQKLVAQLGRGPREVRLSLSRALVSVGEEAAMPALASAADHPEEAVRQHAKATEQLLRDPESGFALDVDTARHEVALGRTRSAVG